VQYKGGKEIPEALELAREGVSGSGQPLPYLQRLQQSFGSYDLSGVRGFADADASLAAHSLGAKAYTTGDRIAFQDARPTLHTVAHEAAHVIQQRDGVQLPGGVGQQGDVYERHADAVADGVVRGLPVQHLLAKSPASGGGSAPAKPASPAVVQRVTAKDLGDLYTMAALDGPRFHKLMKEVATATECKYKYRKGLKDMPRALVKIREKEHDLEAKGSATAETDAVRSLVDMVAGSLVFKSLPDLRTGLLALPAQLAGYGAKIVRLKNRINKPLLRDFLLNIRMKSGFVAELQLHLEPTLEGKQGKPREVTADTSAAGGHTHYAGHDAYDYSRIVEPFVSVLQTVSFGEVISDEVERHELMKRKAAAYHLPDPKSAMEVPSLLEYELAKKTTKERVGIIAHEMQGLYEAIQQEIMRASWGELHDDTAPSESFLDLKRITDIDEGSLQNFGKLRSGGLKEETRIVRAKQRKTAAKALKKSAKADYSPTAILADLYEQLREKRAEKLHSKTAVVTTSKEDISIDRLLSAMKEAIDTLKAVDDPRVKDAKFGLKEAARRTKKHRRKEEEKKLKMTAASD
jgi:hypothetical protein